MQSLAPTASRPGLARPGADVRAASARGLPAGAAVALAGAKSECAPRYTVAGALLAASSLSITTCSRWRGRRKATITAIAVSMKPAATRNAIL